MTKTITIKNANGTESNYLNGLRMNGAREIVKTDHQCIMISDSDLNTIYNEFLQPFINKSPFYMGSMELITVLYTNINSLMVTLNDNKTIIVCQIILDILTVLLKARNIYFDNLRLNNETTTLRLKYQISEYKIIALTKELLELSASCDGDDKQLSFTGSLSVKINQPKNLIYVQAILNINLAWYYYLHVRADIDARLYAATIQYVKTMGTKKNAYDKLIILLDEKYKMIDDVISNVVA